MLLSSGTCGNQITSSLLGSTVIVLKYQARWRIARWSLIFSHFSPPSVVRYTPRFSPGPNGLPSTAAYAVSGLVGCTAMVPIWPTLFQTWVHVLPASVER